MFPQGGPGVGLILLRIAVAAMFVLNVSHPRSFSSNGLYWLVVSLTGVISLGLLLGFLTPILSIIICLVAIPNLSVLDPSMSVIYILTILTSFALFFLGPGAYSVDARLFGLRVTVVPPRKDRKTTTTST